MVSNVSLTLSETNNNLPNKIVNENVTVSHLMIVNISYAIAVPLLIKVVNLSNKFNHCSSNPEYLIH